MPSPGQTILASDYIQSSSGASDAGRIACLDSNGLLSQTFFDSNVLSLKTSSKTASGAIAANDAVYVTAANTVKTIYPSAMGTGAAVSTSTTSNGANKSLPLSTNGLFLHILGGNSGNSAALKAQVRTINAGETDFSNGTEAVIYSTSNGVRVYDVCSIGTDKFLFIYQADTAGAAAGIKAVVITVSGTTVTVGTSVSIETTGSLTTGLAVAKLDTDKGIIFYKKDSDSYPYGQVLTVSGTTITTNTASVVKSATMGSVGWLAACDLQGTNSGMIAYSVSSNANLYARCYTVSGTTITYNTENSLFTTTTSSNFYFNVRPISSTKVFIAYEDLGTATTSKCRTIALTSANATLTASSAFQLSAANITRYFGIYILSATYALVGSVDNASGYSLYFVNISGTTPTAISNQALAHSTSSFQLQSVAIVKVAPWTFLVVGGGNNTDGDFIVKMTPSSTNFIGLAQSAISDTASGVILTRYLMQALTGITLTAGSVYYVDDSGQPTTKSSLSAPRLGIGINTTTLLVQ